MFCVFINCSYFPSSSQFSLIPPFSSSLICSLLFILLSLSYYFLFFFVAVCFLLLFFSLLVFPRRWVSSDRAPPPHLWGEFFSSPMSGPYPLPAIPPYWAKTQHIRGIRTTDDTQHSEEHERPSKPQRRSTHRLMPLIASCSLRRLKVGGHDTYQQIGEMRVGLQTMG